MVERFPNKASAGESVKRPSLFWFIMRRLDAASKLSSMLEK